MSHHEGVSCDSCLQGNFRGRRYKCLICFDYDSCSTCYENGVTSNQHTTDHPMQCILTRSDFDLFYGGETVPNDLPQSFTCPFCGKLGYTESALHEHVSNEHADASAEVICAICASIPGGDANNLTDDFAAHLTLEHRTATGNMAQGSSVAGGGPAPNVSRELEEPQTAIRGRRAPHPTRSALNSSRSSRRQMQYSSTVGLSSLSPGNRDMDPIAELLSQLSGVRRAANSSNSSQLQQLQMQLQLERHASLGRGAGGGYTATSASNTSMAERVPIERVIRRHQQQSSGAPGGPPSLGHPNNSSHNQQAQIMSGAVGNADMPYIVLMDQPSSSHAMGLSSHLASSSGIGVIGGSSGLHLNPHMSSGLGSINVHASSVLPPPAQATNSSRFLLSRCNECNLSEVELAASEISKADKGLFVQELILSTLSDSPSNVSSSSLEVEGGLIHSAKESQSLIPSSSPTELTACNVFHDDDDVDDDEDRSEDDDTDDKSIPSNTSLNQLSRVPTTMSASSNDPKTTSMQAQASLCPSSSSAKMKQQLMAIRRSTSHTPSTGAHVDAINGEG